MPKDLLAPQNLPRDLLEGSAAPERRGLPPGGEDTLAILRRVWEGSAPGRVIRGARALAEDPGGTVAGAARELDKDVRAVAEGATFGFADEIAAGASAALGHGTYEENLAAEQARDQVIAPSRRVAGNVAGAVATLPLLPLKGAGMLRAAGEGAALSGLAGAGFAKPGERLKGAATGATIGAAIPPALQGMARVAAPTVSKAVQTVRDMGVTPTVGQIFPKTVGRIEQGLASVPILGGAMRGARQRAVEQFNIGAVNHVLNFAGMTLPKGTAPGAEAIKKSYQMISRGYDDVLPKMQGRLDRRFVSDVQRIAAEVDLNLTDDVARLFRKQVDRIVKVAGDAKGVLPGQKAKRIMSDLAGRSRNLVGDSDSMRRDLGFLLDDLRQSFSDMLKRGSSPDLAAQLGRLDKAYAGQKHLFVAAAKPGEEAGMFTPAQLQAASRQLDKSLDKRRTAMGEAFMQDVADAGRQVLGPTLPDSGTPERLASMALLAGGPAYIDPLAALGGAGLASLYTRPGQSALARLATRQTGPVGRGVATTLRSLSVPAGVGSAVAAAQNE